MAIDDAWIAEVIAIIPDIREEIFKENKARRVIIKVHTKILDSQDYRGSASKVVNEVFPDWKLDSRVLFLAIEMWAFTGTFLLQEGQLFE